MFNEREDISRILKGDLKAFELLIRQYQQLVYFIIDKLVRNKEDKEDVSQEVFIKVYKNIGSFKFKSKLSTWIASIAYRVAINYIRDHGKGHVVEDIENVEDFHFDEITPDWLSEKKDMKMYIHELLDKMPVRYKSVLTLYHFNEFSYEEIAHITGFPVGTVKSDLFRARKLLKDKLKPYIKDEYPKRSN